MKINVNFQILIAFVFIFSCTILYGQQYQSFDYMKVDPGNHEDYLKLEKVWKKIHEHNIKMGKITGWEFSKIVSPTGASTEYNYVTRTSLKSGEQFETFMETFPMPDDLSTILNPEEMKLINRTGELRTYVKNEIYYTAESILPEGYKNAKVHVFNFFDHPEGKNRSDHIAVEKDIWMPVHEARAKDDKLAGWVLAPMMMPFGANQPYHEVTLDMYKDMSQYMADKSFDKYFEQVHPAKDIDALMKQTRDSAILVKGEVRMVLDIITDTPATAKLN